ncbi:MAG TPA: TonB-dependent receptor [Caulobacteraceae bacterium]|nr:TonB-dependent receptor [Caulobacteraceae bacterium]
MNSRRNLWLAGAALALVPALVAGSASAADKDQNGANTGGEGVEAADVIVRAEASPAAAAAPTKASIDETQPESIISHRFIEQVTPETGGWTTVVLIAPSVSGINSNGGNVGDYNIVRMRGFQDGQFNVTYDGISFADTNDPTHHGADYWPASTIGSAIIDRGPGAAGDLGQANFGGALHYFSPGVSETRGVVQKLTVGTFDTVAAVTTLSTGDISQLGGGRLLLNFDERASAGELSHSGGYHENQLAKFVLPLGSRGELTLFADHQWTRFNFPDSNGPGETLQQVQLYGKNFQLTNIPDEFYYKFNYERKSTDFEYIDLKYRFTDALSIEDQPYVYAYRNQTKSTNDNSGIIGGPNTSPPMAAGANPNDIGGYDKLNAYRVFGDVLRLNQHWSFGELRIGGIIESSATQRHNCFQDFTTGSSPDFKFKPPKFPFTTNCKLLEESDWLQWQGFADFDWYVTDKLRISPGFKYVDFKRDVSAIDENVGGGSKNQGLTATNTYRSPLYFLTANYKVMPYWAIYAQFATSFLTPSLSTLYVTGASLQHLQPETTTNYQLGTVYTRGNLTFDADVYDIEAKNLNVPCIVPGTPPQAAFCNVGSGTYIGVEGEAAFVIAPGLTLFANGSLNRAVQAPTAPNPGAGIGASKGGELANAPQWTDAVGVIYGRGPWEGSVTYKQVGRFKSTDGPVFPGYDTVDASLGYDFGRFIAKVQAFNLADRRPVTGLASGFFTFEAGRQVEVTLIGKF